MPTHSAAATSRIVGSVGVLVLAMVSIQTGAALAKQLFPAVGPAGASTLRLLLAAIILGAVLRPWRVRLTRPVWRSVLVYGIALAGMNAFFYLALVSIPLGIATALEFTGPLFVATIASRRPLDFLWVALALAGLLLLLPIGATTGSVDPVGAGYALAAGICWGLYIVFGQKAGAEQGVRITALGVAIAAVCVFPFGLSQAGVTALFAPEILPLAIAVAVLATAIPYSLEMIGLRRLPRRTFGTLMSLEPAIAALSGLLLLGERLAPIQWLAIMAIIAASVGTTITAVRPEDSPPLSDPPVMGAEGTPEATPA